MLCVCLTKRFVVIAGHGGIGDEESPCLSAVSLGWREHGAALSQTMQAREIVSGALFCFSDSLQS